MKISHIKSTENNIVLIFVLTLIKFYIFMRFFNALIICLFAFTDYSQETFQIHAKIKDLPSKKIWLISINGDKQKLIDTTYSDNKGTISFNIRPNLPVGLYHIVLDYDKYLELVFNQENISLTSELFELIDSTKIIESEENKVLYQHLKYEKMMNQKMLRLKEVMDEFGLHQKISKLCLKEYKNYIKQKTKNYSNIEVSYPKFYSTALIKARLKKEVLPNLPPQEKLNYLKNHFWDNYDFANISLTSSDALSQKLIDFLELYSSKDYSIEKQERAFIEACDFVLPKTKSSQKVYEFTLDFLVRGFEHFGFEKVLKHLSDNYTIETSCENDARKTSLQKKLDSRKSSMIGIKSPEIVIQKINGETFKLSELESTQTLIVFYASWCSHCRDDLPTLNDWYKEFTTKYPNSLKIVAISIDTDKKEWQNFVEQNQFDFIHVSELKGWESKTTDDYNVYATPTFFLLDKDKNILQKTNILKELIQY